ncbi:MAG: MFS transporter [Thermodesulfobacteriota bacterium]
MNKKRRNSVLSSPYVWTFTTYFAEGFPYTVIRTLSSLFLRDAHVRLESVGLTSLFGLPWILKFLWGPQVDRFSTKRTWMLICQFLLVIMMFLTAAAAPFSWGVSAIAVLFFIGAFIAATHDTAIDGFYMEALDKEGQAKFVGYRVMAYRIAMMTGTGVVATIGTLAGWPLAFFCAALMLGLVFVYHFFFLIRVETPGRPAGELAKSALRTKNLALAAGAALLALGGRAFLASTFYRQIQQQYPVLKDVAFPHWVGILLLLALLAILVFRKRIWTRIAGNPDTFYARAFITFTDRKKIGAILAVIILMRTGEFLLTAMVAPFFVDAGIKVHYGWLSSAVGLPLSIAGALAGGFAISTFSLKKVIWPFLLLQNLTNLAYMALALHLAPFVAINTGADAARPIGDANLFWVAVVHGFDQFSGGLGTAVLMTFLMRICAKEFKAAHYAIGTGLMNVSGLFAGVFSGFLAGWMGYGWFFGASFLLSVPGMIAVLFLPADIYVEPAKPSRKN